MFLRVCVAEQADLSAAISFNCRKCQFYSHLICIEFTAYDKINSNTYVLTITVVPTKSDSDVIFYLHMREVG